MSETVTYGGYTIVVNDSNLQPGFVVQHRNGAQGFTSMSSARRHIRYLRARQLGYWNDTRCTCETPDPVLVAGDRTYLEGWFCAHCRKTTAAPARS